MAFIRKEKPQSDSEEKIIEINAKMQGDLVFSDPINLRINGNFVGKLEVKGTLTIGQTARVDAHIVGDNIVIAGKVRGDVTANKMLVLMPTSVVNGNIATPKLNIVEGALFQGHCHMMPETMTVEELAQYLEIEPQAIVDLAKEDKIPCLKEGSSFRFERDKIDQWAASGKVDGQL